MSAAIDASNADDSGEFEAYELAFILTFIERITLEDFEELPMSQRLELLKACSFSSDELCRAMAYMRKWRADADADGMKREIEDAKLKAAPAHGRA